MNVLNLQTDDPVLLVDRATPAELAAAIRRLEQWDERALETTNRLISIWSARAIARTNDREGLSELQRLIHHALKGTVGSPKLPDQFAHRWQAISDLLEARRLNLAHADPAAQLRRRHVPEILRFLALAQSQETPQSALVEHLGVSTSRITQIIGPLESSGLISKRRTGRDNTLRLTQQGRELLPKQQQQEPAPARPRGFISHLTLQAA